MNRISKSFVGISLITFLISFSSYALETQIVASISKEIVSSRKIRIDTLIEGLLYGVQTPKVLNLEVQSDRFQVELNRYILERIVYLESKSFSLIQVKPSEIEAVHAKLKLKANSNPDIKKDWNALEVTPAEAKEIILQKISAQKFVEFKSKSSMLPVTEAEAYGQYINNKKKYEGKVFKDIKDSIKKELSQAQAEQRLTDWYDLLKKKYDVSRIF